MSILNSFSYFNFFKLVNASILLRLLFSLKYIDNYIMLTTFSKALNTEISFI